LLHSEGLEKGQGHRVLDPFGAFRLLLGGGTHVQLPLAKYEIYLTFSKSCQRAEINYKLFCTLKQSRKKVTAVNLLFFFILLPYILHR
jgi:hypothetical protein